MRKKRGHEQGWGGQWGLTFASGWPGRPYREGAFFFFFNVLFIFVRVQAGEGQRERGTEDLKRAPH